MEIKLTKEEADLCRQWFDSLQDTNADFLEANDYALAGKLYEALGVRMPISVISRWVGLAVGPWLPKI